MTRSKNPAKKRSVAKELIDGLKAFAADPSKCRVTVVKKPAAKKRLTKLTTDQLAKAMRAEWLANDMINLFGGWCDTDDNSRRDWTRVAAFVVGLAREGKI